MDTEHLTQTQSGTAAGDEIVDHSSLLGSVLFLQPSSPQGHIESGDPSAAIATILPLPELDDSSYVLRDLAIEPPRLASPAAVVGGSTFPAMSPDNLNLELELLLHDFHTNPAESTDNHVSMSGAPPSQNGHGDPTTIIKRGK